MTSAPSPTTTEGVGFRSERGPVLGALMLTTGLVALDSTIIATAVPSIVQDVGGFTQFPWLFSIYLLTAAVSVPLYGKLADVIGRKPLLFFGIAVFLLGSILCGVAWSMPAVYLAIGLVLVLFVISRWRKRPVHAVADVVQHSGISRESLERARAQAARETQD